MNLYSLEVYLEESIPSQENYQKIFGKEQNFALEHKAIDTADNEVTTSILLCFDCSVQ